MCHVLLKKYTDLDTWHRVLKVIYFSYYYYYYYFTDFFFNQLHLLPWTWMCCIHLLVAILIAVCSIEAASSVENDISARLLSLFWGTHDEIWRFLLIF